MKIAIFSSQPYDKLTLEAANKKFGHTLEFHAGPLAETTAVLASGYPAVCVFVNDDVNSKVIETLAKNGTKLIALRCAGFNNVDLKAAKAHGITVARVPAYSPYAVAEFTVGILLALDRKIPRAWLRVREDNFSLNGLLGRDLHSKVVGIIGTGRIGSLVARTFKLGFGCEVLANDVAQNPEIGKLGIPYVELKEIFNKSDIICLHCPMTPQTRHIVNKDSLKEFKKGATLVNTSRGGLVDPDALVDAIESGHLGGVAMDVYEDEKDLFFRDLSNLVVKDNDFQRLITFPNVLITGHQAFFTKEALSAIAEVTLENATDYEKSGKTKPFVTL